MGQRPLESGVDPQPDCRGWRQRHGAGVGRCAAHDHVAAKGPHQPGTSPLGSRRTGVTFSLWVFQLFKRGFLNHLEGTAQREQPRSRVGTPSASQHESCRLQAVPSQHEALSGRSGPNIAAQWREGCVAGAWPGHAQGSPQTGPHVPIQCTRKDRPRTPFPVLVLAASFSTPQASSSQDLGPRPLLCRWTRSGWLTRHGSPRPRLSLDRSLGVCRRSAE